MAGLMKRSTGRSRLSKGPRTWTWKWSSQPDATEGVLHEKKCLDKRGTGQFTSLKADTSRGKHSSPQRALLYQFPQGRGKYASQSC